MDTCVFFSDARDPSAGCMHALLHPCSIVYIRTGSVGLDRHVSLTLSSTLIENVSCSKVARLQQLLSHDVACSSLFIKNHVKYRHFYCCGTVQQWCLTCWVVRVENDDTATHNIQSNRSKPFEGGQTKSLTHSCPRSYPLAPAYLHDKVPCAINAAVSRSVLTFAEPLPVQRAKRPDRLSPTRRRPCGTEIV